VCVEHPAQHEDWTCAHVNDFSAEIAADPAAGGGEIVQAQPGKGYCKGDDESDEVIVQSGWISLSLVKFPFDFPFSVTFCHNGAFVVELLPFGYCDLQFRSAILQIYPDRNDGDTFLANDVP